MRFRTRRKPWTRDWKIALDVLAAYCTLQFYALIHIFFKFHKDTTQWQQWQLFLPALGVLVLLTGLLLVGMFFSQSVKKR
jgi:hypothetical protein